MGQKFRRHNPVLLEDSSEYLDRMLAVPVQAQHTADSSSLNNHFVLVARAYPSVVSLLHKLVCLQRYSQASDIRTSQTMFSSPHIMPAARSHAAADPALHDP